MKPSLDRLEKLMFDRETIPSHVVGFLIAYKDALHLHQSMACGKIEFKKELVPLVTAHLAIFAVRALETFFRDCFITICLSKPEFGFAAADKTKGQLTYSDVKELLDHPNKFHELLAAQKNFQNLDIVNDAFSPFFGRSLLDFFDVTDFFVYTADSSVTPVKFRLTTLYPTWRADLYALFALRHEVIHNAHHPLPTNQDAVVRAAQVALLLGQLMGVAVASQIGVGTLSVEVPLKKMLLMEHLPQLVAISEEQRQKFMSDLETFGDATGHLGPFIFLGQDLIQTEFEPLVEASPSLEKNRLIVHLVNRPAADRFVVQTLRSIQVQQTDNRAA